MDIGVPLECNILRGSLYLDGQGKNLQQSILPVCIKLQDFKMCLQFCNQISRKIVRKIAGGLEMGGGESFGFRFLFCFSKIDSVNLQTNIRSLCCGEPPSLWAECRFGA